MQLFRLQLLTFGLFATCILVVVLQVRASDEDEATEKPPTEEEKETVTEETTEEPPKPEKPPVKELRIGVKYRVSCEKEEKTKGGDKLSMHYTGTLHSNGEKFDSSVDRGTPFEFTLGAGQVIKGWDRGLVGMCKGEKRRLVIPAELGYGDRGSPPKIPGGASLVFEVELLDYTRPGAKAEL
ncbi:FK506-binding protein 2-like [Convolutriloba macropyga]|uniref:FK506-binding protein 2-like n=1 Tax=Convolutriloba macropyga TaxID=536237 RepID=UPI003F5248E3